MADRSSLLSSIRGFKKNKLQAAEVVDKSGPVGVVDQPKAAPPKISKKPSKKKKSKRTKSVQQSAPQPTLQYQPPVALPQAERQASVPAPVPTPSQSQAPAPSAVDERALVVAEKKKKKKKKKDKKKKNGESRKITALDIYDEEVNDSLAESLHRPPQLLVLLFFMGSIGFADLSIILPTLYDYSIEVGGSYLEYGFTLGAYNLGQIIAAPVFGFWTDYRLTRLAIKEVLMMSSLLACLGNIIYLVHSKPALILIGRFVSGLGTGYVFVAYSHITRVSGSQDERDYRITLYSWFTRLAQIVAPALGSVGDHLKKQKYIGVEVSRYTFPVLVMAIAFGSLFLMFAVHYALTYRRHARNVGALSLESSYWERKDSSMDSAPNVQLNQNAIILMVSYFAVLLTYWAFATALFPFAREVYMWKVSEAFYLFVYIGCVFTFFFAVLKVAQIFVHDSKLLFASSVLMCIGSLLLIKYTKDVISKYQLFVGGSFIAGGYTVQTVLIPTLFASECGVKMENLGLRMSWWFGMSALASALGPIAGASIMHYSHFSMVGVMGTVVMALIVVLLLLKPIGPSRAAIDKARKQRKDGDVLHKSLLEEQEQMESMYALK